MKQSIVGYIFSQIFDSSKCVLWNSIPSDSILQSPRVKLNEMDIFKVVYVKGDDDSNNHNDIPSNQLI